ncbi:MAG: TetR/AcrR family transcriptional regulator [Candidatus Marinamargulisbacteria bacterium]
MNQESTKQKIMRVAQTLIRQSGYHGFSFRDISLAVNIKTASIHYYFPTKAILVQAIAEDYTMTFMEKLGDPDIFLSTKKRPMDGYIHLFESSFLNDQNMCLCGFLGVEKSLLPTDIQAAVTSFFDQNMRWLTRVYSGYGVQSPEPLAFQTLALLEGAMVTCKALNDATLFNTLSSAIHQLLDAAKSSVSI